jgi:predicted component of type VI protein secretion system
VVAVHRCQIYVRLGVGVPVKVTAEVKVLPLTKVPVGAVVADTCGATGVSVGVADVELEDAEEVPPVFVAVEVKVYAVPLVNPDTTQDPDAPVTVHVFPAKTPEESEA